MKDHAVEYDNTVCMEYEHVSISYQIRGNLKYRDFNDLFLMWVEFM